MRFRELQLRPIAGTPALDGHPRIYRPGDGKNIAVLSGPLSERAILKVAAELQEQGFAGTVISLPPGREFTLLEVDDGAPAGWQEDGRPSYADLERRVKELESLAAMGSGADSEPLMVRL
jgi:hypothetical protein